MASIRGAPGPDFARVMYHSLTMRTALHLLLFALVCGSASVCAQQKNQEQKQDWPVYGGAPGRIDLRKDLGRTAETQSIVLSSPGIIYQDLIIVGGRNPETLPAPPGDVRAYDVRSGKLRWSFHTIPHPGEFGYETWPADA